MTYYVAEHVMVNPLQMKNNVGERRGRKRETQGMGEHMTRGRYVSVFRAADNLNASNSTSCTNIPQLISTALKIQIVSYYS